MYSRPKIQKYIVGYGCATLAMFREKKFIHHHLPAIFMSTIGILLFRKYYINYIL